MLYPSKCDLFPKYFDNHGHIISPRCLKPAESTKNAVAFLDHYTIWTELYSFIGFVTSSSPLSRVLSALLTNQQII